jgi:hypothetical protein
MKREIFIPKELENEKTFFSFGTMSTAYWDFAKEMETNANKQFNTQFSSFYVFPTIIFYCASFEALLNEGLTAILLYDNSKEEEITTIKNAQGDYRDVAKKIKICATYLDRKSKGIINENILQEYIALSELRNAILHYNPQFGSIFHYPPRLESAFARSKVKAIVGGDWVETFKTKVVLYWAKETIRNIIDCFLEFQQKDEKEFYKE